MRAGPLLGEPTHHDDVVGVELTIDGMLVIADRLQLVDFPTSLGIRPNIPFEDERTVVWDQVTRDLTAQGIITPFGDPHAEVAAMVNTLSRPDRNLDCRWWRRDVGDRILRFVVCRQGDRHVVAARDDEMLVLQRVSPRISLADMVNTVIGTAAPANVEPLTGISADLAQAHGAGQLARYDLSPASARIYADATSKPASWVEITASERHPGGTYSHAGVGAGVLDSEHGRIVSLPRRVSGRLYGSFLPGTQQNLQRALDALLQFLPATAWFDHEDAIGSGTCDVSGEALPANAERLRKAVYGDSASARRS